VDRRGSRHDGTDEARARRRVHHLRGFRPGRDIWTAMDGQSKVAWFADPDGNVLSISQA
jgi:hypothetical protein